MAGIPLATRRFLKAFAGLLDAARTGSKQVRTDTLLIDLLLSKPLCDIKAATGLSFRTCALKELLTQRFAAWRTDETPPESPATSNELLLACSLE